MKRALVIACICVVMLARAVAAYSDIVSYTVNIPAAKTNWSQFAAVPKFDPVLGTLTAVEYEATGQILGQAMFESFSGIPGCVRLNLRAEVRLQWPEDTVLLTLAPTAVLVEPVGAYDGVWDWAGTSGRTAAYLAQQTGTSQGPVGGDLSAFVGTGDLMMPASARVFMEISGPGNLYALVDTEAGADVTVKYHFLRVPEPASMLVLGAAITGSFGMFLRRRKSR